MTNTMTEFDKMLIEKVHQRGRWSYQDIDILAYYTDTKEARDELYEIQFYFRDSCDESR